MRWLEPTVHGKSRLLVSRQWPLPHKTTVSCKLIWSTVWSKRWLPTFSLGCNITKSHTTLPLLLSESVFVLTRLPSRYREGSHVQSFRPCYRSHASRTALQEVGEYIAVKSCSSLHHTLPDFDLADVLPRRPQSFLLCFRTMRSRPVRAVDSRDQ